jgi:hypothetical protein
LDEDAAALHDDSCTTYAQRLTGDLAGKVNHEVCRQVIENKGKMRIEFAH